MTSPFIVGVGGAAGVGSATELAMREALRNAEAQGATTQGFGSDFLIRLPLYEPGLQARSPEEMAFVEAIRRADGLILASPSYHGGVSGLVKNAIDLIDELRKDARPYLDGRAVGLIAVAAGWQATGTTLMALRSIVHALRGWPTPLGAGLNTAEPIFDAAGACTDDTAADQLRTVAKQVMDFARAFGGD